MKVRKWLVSLIIVLPAALIGFAGLMYILDPLLHYGKESAPLTYYTYAEMYSNPGIARHYEYDTVLVGTSMIENTDVDEFDQRIGSRAVRLPYSGGTALNMRKILEICFSSGNNIRAVYWEMDEFQLFSNPDETRYPLPEYLYRDDHRDDLFYLLNLDIFYHYAVKDIIGTLRGQIQKAERRGETLYGDFGRSALLAGYSRQEKSETKPDAAPFMKKTEANLLQNIKSVVEAHPDTEFVFYFVPFSILYWDQEVRKGSFDITIDAVEYAVGQLIEYDNVKIYFFHNEEEIITDLDNYKDYSHYGKWINSYLTQAMAEGRNLLRRDTYQEKIEEMRQFIYSYDFEAVFE